MRIKGLTCIVLGLGLAACESTVVEPKPPEGVARVQQTLVSELEATDEIVDVIVNFREPPQPFAGTRRELYRMLQDDLLARHSVGLKIRRRFIHVPALAVRINRGAFEKLKNDPNVEYIQLDGRGGGALKEAVPAIGGDQAKKLYNVTGKAIRVGVLDTGVVTKHPDLADSVVAQHCFTQSDCPPSRSLEGTSAEDDHGHGTNVAGIIASNGTVSSVGFAPDAELVAVKINDQNDSGQLSDWVAGLDWIYDNLSTLKVKVINMSICSTAVYSDAATCDSNEPAMAAAVKNLVDAGVVLFAASGNLGYTNQLSSPACNTGVIAVAATYDSALGAQPPSGTYMSQYGFGVANCADSTTAFDQITCFSNTPARVDMVAPGAVIDSDGLNNGPSTYRGTSQASPAAAGVAALLLQCNRKLTPAQVKKAMIDTAVKVVDSKSNKSFPSIRALKALQSVCNAGSSGAAGAAGGVAGAGGKNATEGSGGAAGNAGARAGSSGLAGAAGAVTVTGAAGQTGFGGQSVTTVVSTGGVTGAVAGTLAPVTGTGAGAQDGCGCYILGSRRHQTERQLGPVSLAFLALALGAGLRRRRRS